MFLLYISLLFFSSRIRFWIKFFSLFLSITTMMFARTTPASSSSGAVFFASRRRQSSSRVCSSGSDNKNSGERRRTTRTNWNLLLSSSSSSSSALRAVAKPPPPGVGEDEDDEEEIALPDEVKDLKLQDIISLWVTQILQTYEDKPSSDNAPIVEGEIDDLVGGPIFLALYPYFRCVFCFCLEKTMMRS